MWKLKDEYPERWVRIVSIGKLCYRPAPMGKEGEVYACFQCLFLHIYNTIISSTKYSMLLYNTNKIIYLLIKNSYHCFCCQKAVYFLNIYYQQTKVVCADISCEQLIFIWLHVHACATYTLHIKTNVSKGGKKNKLTNISYENLIFISLQMHVLKQKF